MKKIMSLVILGIVAYSFQPTISNENKLIYRTASSDSHVTWSGWHLGKTYERYGKVYVKNGNLVLNKNNIEKGFVKLAMNTLTVENFKTDSNLAKQLRGHLLSQDFFHVDSFPISTFNILSVQDTLGDYNSIIVGNLTLKNHTEIISFLANVNATVDSISITSQPFEIDRMRWGISYHHENTKGIQADYLIMNSIKLRINATFYP